MREYEDKFDMTDAELSSLSRLVRFAGPLAWFVLLLELLLTLFVDEDVDEDVVKEDDLVARCAVDDDDDDDVEDGLLVRVGFILESFMCTAR